VHVGERGPHPSRERLIGRVLLERVQPDNAKGEAGLREQVRVADVEAVRADEHDRPARHAPVRVLTEEATHRFADARYLGTQHKQMAERSTKQAQAAQAQVDDYVRSVAGGAAAEIERAKKLLDTGAISQAEFDQIKQKALA
jgi:hypothetical protein